MAEGERVRQYPREVPRERPVSAHREQEVKVLTLEGATSPVYIHVRNRSCESLPIVPHERCESSNLILVQVRWKSESDRNTERPGSGTITCKERGPGESGDYLDESRTVRA